MTSGWHSRHSGRLPWCTLDRNPPANAEDKVREEFTCRGATKPVCHNYWGLSSSTCDLQQDKPPQWRASTTKKIIIIIKWINWLFFQKDVGEKLHRVKGPELEARQSGFESHTITPSCDPREGLRSSVSPSGNWRWNFCLRGWLFYSWAHLEPWYILGVTSCCYSYSQTGHLLWQISTEKVRGKLDVCPHWDQLTSTSDIANTSGQGDW